MREPDINTVYARVWSIDLELLYAHHKIPLEERGLIAIWIAHVPQSHPVWPWIYISMCHLRPSPSLGDPLIYLKGATHELVIRALDPEYYPIDVDAFEQRTLIPDNFAAQFIAPSDADAVDRVLREAIIPMAGGSLNPDTDGRRDWVRIFGDNMIKEEFRDG